jgi:tetratricopeptide (TPR) repeat protein
MFGDANGKRVFPEAKMNDTERKIVAAQGYVELGLYSEARRELACLPPAMETRPEVMELAVLCLMGEKRWDDALSMARNLCLAEPSEAGGYIHAAYCLHELGHTQDALDVLASGPPSLQTKAVYFYNMGCYHACLGETETAVKLLEKAFEKDSRLRRDAKRDRDLAQLRDRLGIA